MDYRRLSWWIVVVVVVAVLLTFVVPTWVRAHREARELGNQQLFAQLNNATTMEEIQKLRGAYLPEEWLLEHGARRIANPYGGETHYLHYTPKDFGEPVVIIYDGLWGGNQMICGIDLEEPEQPKPTPVTQQQLVALLGRSHQLKVVDVIFQHPSDGCLVQVTSDDQGGLEMIRLAESEPRQARLK